MGEKEKDRLFLEEYGKLCQKYDRYIDGEIENYDQTILMVKKKFDNQEAIWHDIPFPTERNEFEEKENLLRRQKEKERQDQLLLDYEKGLQAYVDSGKELNIFGEIPPAYYSYGFDPQPKIRWPGQSPGGHNYYWGAYLKKYEDSVNEILSMLEEKPLTYTEISGRLKGSYSDIRKTIECLCDTGKIKAVRSGTKVYLERVEK